MAKSGLQDSSEVRHRWRRVALVYGRFEALVAAILTFIIAAVIAVALLRLSYSVVDALVLRSLNPLDHRVFQSVFGEILTVLIALEFNHSLRYVVTRERSIVQAKTVILVAVLALVRKVMVTDLSVIAPGTLIAEATLLLALGITYWLVRDRDNRPWRRSGLREKPQESLPHLR
jgi:uncharacterized membrane protein (DUF373 family)